LRRSSRAAPSRSPTWRHRRSDMARTLKLRSRSIPRGRSGRLVAITPRQAGWRYIEFNVRQLARGATWRLDTGREEVCIVLLEGECEISWDSERHRLGPRKDVFSAY